MDTKLARNIGNAKSMIVIKNLTKEAWFAGHFDDGLVFFKHKRFSVSDEAYNGIQHDKS